jgi:hypothetical protein
MWSAPRECRYMSAPPHFTVWTRHWLVVLVSRGWIAHDSVMGGVRAWRVQHLPQQEVQAAPLVVV